MRSMAYDCGCLVMRDDSGHAKDVIRCSQHKDYRDVGVLVRVLDTQPVLEVKITDTIKVKDRTGR